MYLAYALFCEGPSDYSYFEVLVPRVIESTVLKVGKTPVDVPERPSLRLGRKGRSVDAVAREACDGREAFHVVFVHADTGGRGQQARLPERSTAYCMRMHEECELRRERCVLLRPASMMESWALADPQAVLDALGYRGAPAELGLPGRSRAGGGSSGSERVPSLGISYGSGSPRGTWRHPSARHRPAPIDRRPEAVEIVPGAGTQPAYGAG